MTDVLEAPLDPIEPTPKKRSPLVPVVIVLAAALLIVGGVVVARDGDHGGASDPIALLSAAPDAAREAGTAHVSMSISVDGGAMSLDISGEGDADFESGAGTFSMSVMGRDVEMRSDGETVWMQLPGEADKWVAVPTTEMEGRELLPNANTATGLVDALRGVGGEVVDHGTETVNGVEARHYSTTIDIQKAMEQAAPDQKDEVEQALAQLGGAAVPVDVWVTDDGLPVRTELSFKPSADAGGLLGDVTMLITVEMSDFGEPVDVQPPDPADVVDVDPSMIDGMFGGGTPDEVFGSGSDMRPPD